MVELIRPNLELDRKLNACIEEFQLQPFQEEIDYHFNREKWCVNLADTKKSMINYDFRDLISGFYARCRQRDGETNKEFKQREQEETERLRSTLMKLYIEFREYVTEKLTPTVEKMDYNDLLQLFQDTWGEAPFKINYLLEDMFLLLGNKSIMQNVVGNSGSFKSTRSMIEFNSLPSVLIMDDATVAGISRDCQTKGNDYLDNTVVYYNDVGDSAGMQNNFKECLQSVYKKLFSEGMVNRTLAMKNSDKTLRLNLRTPNGFKLKFNSVKPIFNDDDGQTKARTMLINLPSYTAEQSEEMVRSGRFGKAVYSNKDPRIFKDVLKIYYNTRKFDGFTGDFNGELAHRYNQDSDEESNFHGIAGTIHIHEEMCKLYGTELYKEKYYNRVMIGTRVSDMEKKLYDIIVDGLNMPVWIYNEIQSFDDPRPYVIAKTKSASAHKNKNDYNAFTVKAVKGIRRDFVRKNATKISSLLKAMEEHELCVKVATVNKYNVYVLLPKDMEEQK